jgi:hypothetical protein
MKARILTPLVLIPLFALSSSSGQTNLAFYVAPGGSDAGSGSRLIPFASLERARDAIRATRLGHSSNPTAYIWVEEGTFYRTNTFQLTSLDTNLVISAEPTASPRLCGGVRLEPGWCSVVPSNSSMWSRLDASAQGVALQVDLGAHGITNLGVLKTRGMSGLSGSDPGPFTAELFCNEQPLELARWPNKGTFATTAGTTATNNFTYTGTRPGRWLNAPDPWYHGYWYYMWADFAMAGSSIATNASTITLAAAPRSYGIRSGQPWFAFDLLEEMDTPGEYYIDRLQKMLYLWPPASFASADLLLSQLDGALISLQGATNVVIHGLELLGGRGDLLTLDSKCANVEFRYGRLIGAGRRGAVLDGVSNRLTACEIAFTGDHGVVLSGGNRLTLTPGGNTVGNCRIHDFSRLSFTYTPAASVSGVGQVVLHNQISSAPHAGILFSGNEHLLAFNDIHQVCQWTSDAGAVYAGRDWGFRGNRVTCNFIHDVSSGFSGYGVHAVYLDDCVSGIEVSSNVLYRVQNYATFNGGGRDNFYFNNVVARCGTFHYGDARGPANINTTPGDSWNLLQKIQAVNYQQSPWSNAYPALAAIPNSWSSITNDPSRSGYDWRKPGGTVFSRNIGWTNNTAFSGSGSAFSYYAQWTNNITNSNPLFVDEAGLDLTLRSNSPAFGIAGFGAIPFRAIGVGLPALSLQSTRLTPSATAQVWVDPKLDSNCTVQFWTGAADCGRTTNGWDSSITTNLPSPGFAGWVAFRVPAGAACGRFRAVNQQGETWSQPAFALPTSPTSISINLPAGGAQLHLLWPSAYTGWLLQSNSVGVVAPNSWFTVSGSDVTNQAFISINPAKTSVFYRLTYP